ncbi:MAG: CBS domain-containing protein [Desulfobacterales bacterium]|nr:CBS domain-containing protein [Desulfobacterales bacterium]
MPQVQTRKVLTGIRVREAMRRQVVALDKDVAAGESVRRLIKYKINALLITDTGVPCGVVSKTDLLAMMYAGLEPETPVGEVMSGPPVACYPDDPLEDGLEIMQGCGVHQLFVIGASREHVIGILSYADIVGLLYRYCHACRKSTRARKPVGGDDRVPIELIVEEVMTLDVQFAYESDTLYTVIDTLSARGLGAILIYAADGRVAGVVSKTDLIRVWLHGVQATVTAGEVMSTPVQICWKNIKLTEALQQMLIQDVQRLFVGEPESGTIVGVLSLSDAARFQSGSCRACLSGRLLV